MRKNGTRTKWDRDKMGQDIWVPEKKWDMGIIGTREKLIHRKKLIFNSNLITTTEDDMKV